MRLPIYMDHHATTPCDPLVVEAMLPYFQEEFGNAASRNHVFGWRAEEAVEGARAQIAAAIGARPKEILFTSGATESDNLMLKGLARYQPETRDHIITVATEHPAVLDSVVRLEQDGFHITRLSVAGDGMLDPTRVADAMTERTAVVSVMWVNNEIGVIQPIAEIAGLCRQRGVPFAVDGAQTLAKIPVDVRAMGVDLLSLSSHKMYGPKGIGALYIRSGSPRIRLRAEMDGGGHERGFRSGTLNVPGIVGFARACQLAVERQAEDERRILALREKLREGIFSRIEGVHLNGSLDHRVAGNLNVSFDGVEGESLLMALRDVALSSGSACASAAAEPSHVIRALGVGDDLAHASLRFGIGRGNSEDEIDFLLDLIQEKVEHLRSLAPHSGRLRRVVQ
jgi:cysteine desulfurase